ncbi:MAG: helix-turn-helix domain-containing protein [Ruminococcaceae bacterium]|nr:helix-turn-helix domain-containing protein [Oscillospiraceae bacterium]
MNTETVGKRICAGRKKMGYTQEQLAEKIGVSTQAVSKWENGHNLPDIDNLAIIARVLKIPYTSLVSDEKEAFDINFRSRLFHENNMYTRVKTLAQTNNLVNTLNALVFMREKHSGQYRKGSRYATESVEYINHPLMMTCHALAMGIDDDSILAAILLHDVLEDTDTAQEDLPVSDEIKEIVRLVTFQTLAGKSKEESKAIYYEAIRQNPKACVVKIIDRCNNVSTMAGCFTREKLVSYIEETETYIMPLITTLKNRYPAYSDIAFLVKYQIISLIESIKSLL